MTSAEPVRLRLAARRREGDQVVIAAEVHVPEVGDFEHWYRVPEPWADAVVESADPFVLPLLYRAMADDRPLVVDGPASPSMLRNLVEYQAAIARLSREAPHEGQPRFHEVDIEVSDESERVRPADDAVAAFSGGIDSTYTVQRHAFGLLGRATRPLTAAVLVQGFDIALDEVEGFAHAAARARRILDDVGVELIEVASNVRWGEPTWLDLHGLAVPAALTLFGGRFSEGIVAGTVPYERLDTARGQHPALDWMAGSDAFTVIHDGAAADRIEKAESLLVWDAAMADLRFCFVGSREGINCGRCPKCVKTWMVFRALGVTPACFDVPVTEEVVDRLLPELSSGEPTRRYYSEVVLAAADERGVTEPWVGKLRSTLEPTGPA
jgi:hypothetical protein